jgi:hypothetical protein
MASRHPHADAEYSILTRSDGSFAIRIVIPEQQPALVTGFATRPEAVAWADRHKQRVLEVPQRRAPFKWSR